MNNISIAAFQGYAIYGDLKRSLGVIQNAIRWSESKDINILCFPECFLQGYVLDENEARKLSLDLNSEAFFIAF